jgi:tetratricopeptide (TPR) repeat protein
MVKFEVLIVFVSLFFGIVFGQSTSHLKDSISTEHRTSSPKKRLNILMDLIIEFRGYDKRKTIKYCEEAEVIAIQLQSHDDLATIYYTLSSIYSWVNSEKSIAYAEKGLFLCTTNGMAIRSGDFYNLLGRIAATGDDYEASIRFFNRAFSIFEKFKEESKMAFSSSNLGHSYKGKGDFIRAIEYLTAAKKYYDNSGRQQETVVILSNIGDCWLELGQKTKALAYYEKALTLAHKGTSNYDLGVCYITMAEFYFRDNEYNKAIENSEKGIGFALIDNNRYLLRFGYEIMYKSHKSLGNYESALEMYELLTSTSDSLSKEKNSDRIDDLRTSLELQETKYKYALLEADQKKSIEQQKAKTYQNRFLVLLIVILLVVIFMLHLFYRNRILKSKLNQKSLDSKINSKNRELMNLAIHIKQRSQFISDLKRDLKLIRDVSTKHEKEELVTNALLKIGQHVRLEESMESFLERIEALSAEFLARLNETYPDLTENEKKLALYLRMNLSSKEIALITNISPSSVDVSRYRLRKKINLDTSEDLVDCFNKI